MTLFIALNGELNDSLVEHLQLFYTKKDYTVLVLQDQPKNEITNILNRYNPFIFEVLLLKAFNRSFNYNQQKYEKYD